nr:acyl-CoA dehydrogenase family protein [Planosporangium mesophilum]
MLAGHGNSGHGNSGHGNSGHGNSGHDDSRHDISGHGDAGHGEVIDSIAAGTVRPIVGSADDDGVVRHLDGAQPATHVLLLPRRSGDPVELRPIATRTPTPGLAVPAWCSAVPGGPALVRFAPDPGAVDEARALLRLGLVTRAMAAAERANELAIEHATVRHQFGRPVGSFQAVSHRCVNGVIDATTLRRLVDEAVRAYLSGVPWLLAAELAVTFGVTAAPRVQFGAHHTLAAVGYFEEHPAPWLFRRVHADTTRVAGYPLDAGEPADLLLENGAGLPPLDLGPEAEAFRAEVLTFLDEYAKAHGDDATTDDASMVEALAARGYLAPGFPTRYSGRDASIDERIVLSQELGYRDIAMTARTAVDMLGPAIARHGTEEQKSRFLPMLAQGRLPFYLGYSEPETGSDLARLRTRAVRDGDEWVINGVKMWGTGGDAAQWVWLAARTDPDASPHAGLTVFLFPTGLPGWSRQDHTSLAGHVSCSTFFDDVRVPDSARIGEVNGGWRVLTEALAHERIAIASGTARLYRQFDALLELARRDPVGVVGPRGSASRRRISELAARMQAARTLASSGAQATLAGGGISVEAPMAKIVGSELEEDLGTAVLQLLGPAAALATGERVPEHHSFEYTLRLSVMSVVAGGTNDIQRNLIARALGLPR